MNGFNLKMLLIGLSASLTGNALAASPIYAQCIINNTVSGQIVQSNSGLQAVEASGGILGGASGSPGQITLNCTTPTLLTVLPPVKITAPSGFNPTVQQAIVQLNGTSAYTATSNGGGQFSHTPWGNNATAPLTIPSNTSSVVNLGLIVGQQTQGTPAPGTYSYRLQLLLTPN